MTFHYNLLVAFAIINFLTTFFLSVSSLKSEIPNLSSTHKHGPWEALFNLTNVQPGKNCKGLSNIKKYFHQFGYLPNTPLSFSNLTDDFDDALVSAIRTFQTNYKLNVTGKLDNGTLRHIVQPRCGVADVIHSKKQQSTKSSHFHTVEHYAYFNGFPRWPAGTQRLTYAFFPGNNLNNVYKSVFASAFSKWTPVVGISFQETTSFNTADIKIAFARGEHGDGLPFDGSLGILAHAFPPTNGRFHLDADEYWVVSGDVAQSPVQTAVDLESVAVHEIGHLLGLAHSSDKNAVMYAYLTPRTKKVELTNDDIQGIRQLYGTNN